jgi:hypothetical protein
MGFLVTGGAMMMCTMGAAPATMNVLPVGMVNAGPQAAATAMDNAPMLNIPPFGVCMSMSNPQVASATAAALGVLTPMPCMPNVPGPWAPGSPTVQIGGKPALNDASMATCAFGGSISITVPGQFTVQVP